MTSHFLFSPSSGSNNDAVQIQERDHDDKQPVFTSRPGAGLSSSGLFSFLPVGVALSLEVR